MKKFTIHTEWIDYYRSLLDDVDEGDMLRLLDTTLEAFVLFEQIARYAESGEYCFNDAQCRAKFMFLSLKPQIDEDLKALKEMEDKGNE